MPDTPARPELPPAWGSAINDNGDGHIDLYDADTVLRLLADERRKALGEATQIAEETDYSPSYEQRDGFIRSTRRHIAARIRALIDRKEPTPITTQKKRALKRCAAARDGDCSHIDCPQLRDGEPVKSGRHCPLDIRDKE
jgi:hypothetical protein